MQKNSIKIRLYLRVVLISIFNIIFIFNKLFRPFYHLTSKRCHTLLKRKIKVSNKLTNNFQFELFTFHILFRCKDLLEISANPITPDVHKMVEHTPKIWHHLLKDFKRVFDYFVDTKHQRVYFPD